MVLKSAFNRRIREFEILNHGFKNIEEFLLSALEVYHVQLSKAVAEFNLIKTFNKINKFVPNIGLRIENRNKSK